MKVNGKDPKAIGPRESVVVIPVGGSTFTFKARMVNVEKFGDILKAPEPPESIGKEGTTFKDYENAKYLEDAMKWATYQTDWWILESLKATEDLVWDTVDMSDPETFGNWKTELEEAQFSQTEIVAIINIVNEANGMSQERLEEATQSFLAEEAAKLTTTT